MRLAGGSMCPSGRPDASIQNRPFFLMKSPYLGQSRSIATLFSNRPLKSGMPSDIITGFFGVTLSSSHWFRSYFRDLLAGYGHCLGGGEVLIDRENLAVVENQIGGLRLQHNGRSCNQHDQESPSAHEKFPLHTLPPEQMGGYFRDSIRGLQ